MLTASTSRQFIVRIPLGFVPDWVEEKYMPYLEQRYSVYPSITEFLNGHIQKVSLTPVTQRTQVKQVDQRHPSGRSYRDPNYPGGFIQGELTITFKLDGAYLVWNILNDILIHYNTDFDSKFLPSFVLSLTDAFGITVNTIECNYVLINHVTTNIAIDYSTNAIETRTVECRLFSNRIDQTYTYAHKGTDDPSHDDDIRKIS